MADGIDLERELDRLYGLPAGEFVGARNALAKRLRQAGDRTAAERIKALARPSPSAWAVNQLAFRARAELVGLQAAGERVRAAHLAGPPEQQAAAKARRAAISTLRTIAEVALQEAGVAPSRAHRQRIAQTLEVLSSQGSDPDLPRAGRLAADLESAGFDALSDLAAALAAAQQARPVVAAPTPAAGPRAGPAAASSNQVEHPAAQQQEQLAARQVAERRAGERRELDQQRARARARLERLAAAAVSLGAAAGRAAGELERTEGSAAALARAAQDAERLARESGARAQAAADVAAQARSEAESAAAAERVAAAEAEAARLELERLDVARRRLDD